MSADSELLDAFKSAALSVTKLYKTSAAAQAKARSDGYQECLDDLLTFLDKAGIGLTDGEGWRIRSWATERLEGRDSVIQTTESEDETDNNNNSSSSSKPEPQLPAHQQHNSGATQSPGHAREEVQMRDSAPPTLPVSHQYQHSNHERSSSPAAEDVEIVVPTQDTFTFQSSIPYPSDSYMNLANLDLSDNQSHGVARSAPPSSTARNPRGRRTTTTGAGARSVRQVTGQKRKVNLAEFFDLGSLGYGNGKDVFGDRGPNGGGKRNRLV